ncbi:hypothetical protein [uncultured Cardiobacterium sp.]|nr:hypothetical protein [uncultured Cardiobacterium sp.]
MLARLAVVAHRMVCLVRDGETLLSGGNAVWQVAVRQGLQGLANS